MNCKKSTITLLKMVSYYTPANEVWEGVYRSHLVGRSVGRSGCRFVGLSVGCSVPLMFVERTTFTFSTRLLSNFACVILTTGRCA